MFIGFIGTPCLSRTGDSSLGGMCYIHLTKGAYCIYIQFWGWLTYHLGGACSIHLTKEAYLELLGFGGRSTYHLGGPCYIHLTMGAFVLNYITTQLFFCQHLGKLLFGFLGIIFENFEYK